MSQIKTTEIEGDVAIGRHITTGGNATIQGNTTVKKNLRVEGWLDARNIKGPGKGLFQDVAKLREAYPSPHDGWWALVGSTLPAPLYIADGGVWVATDQSAGNPTIDDVQCREAVDELDADLTALASDVTGLETRIATSENNISANKRSIEQLQTQTETLGDSVGSISSDAAAALSSAEMALTKAIEAEGVAGGASSDAASALSAANEAVGTAGSAASDAAQALADATQALSAATVAKETAEGLLPRVAALEDATVDMSVAAVAGWIDESGAECESDGSDVGDGGHHVSVSCLRTGFIRLCDGSFTFTSPGGTQLVVVKYNGNTLAERIVYEGNSWAVRYSEGMLEVGEVPYNRVRLCYKRGSVAGVVDNITVSAKASAIATLTERNKAGVAELEELRAYAEGNHGDITALTEQIAAMKPVQVTEEELETLVAEEGRLYFIPED